MAETEFGMMARVFAELGIREVKALHVESAVFGSAEGMASMLAARTDV